MPPTSGFSFRREVTDQILPIPCHLMRLCDDYLQRVTIFLVEVCAVEGSLGKYRIHGENITAMAGASYSGVLRKAEDERLVIEAQKEFLARRFGEELADCVRIQDIPHYWEYLLALCLLTPGRPRCVLGYRVEEIFAHLPEKPRKRLWRLLLSLPQPIGKRCLDLWWTPGWWKRYIEFALRSLRLRSW